MSAGPRIIPAFDPEDRFIGYSVLDMGADAVATFLFADYPEGSGAFVAAEVERDHVDALWIEANTDPLKLTPEERADDKAAREQYEADTETLRDHE